MHAHQRDHRFDSCMPIGWVLGYEPIQVSRQTQLGGWTSRTSYAYFVPASALHRKTAVVVPDVSLLPSPTHEQLLCGIYPRLAALCRSEVKIDTSCISHFCRDSHKRAYH